MAALFEFSFYWLQVLCSFSEQPIMVKKNPVWFLGTNELGHRLRMA